MYSKRLLCFSLPRTNSDDNEHTTNMLLNALRSTVELLPFLAGSIILFSKDQPWLRDIQPQGAAYLEVQDFSSSLDFLDLRKASFAPSLLDADELCPFPASTYIKDSPLDVCRLRANFVKNGLILVLQIAHTVCDGRGISEVLQIFADKLRENQTGQLASGTLTSSAQRAKYSFDRNSVLSGDGMSGDIERHPCWTASPLSSHKDFTNAKTRCSIFYIGSDSLRALKLAIVSSSLYSLSDSAANNTNSLQRPQSSASEQGESTSTHDAISALIWRSIVLARQRAGILFDVTTVHFSTAVDCRSRLGLPTPYFGNAIYGVKTSLILAALQNHTARPSSSIMGLQVSASAIRRAIQSVSAAQFRDLLNFVERTQMKMLTRLSVVEDLATSTVMLVSYWRFAMHALDFGEALGGSIEAFRLPSQGLVPGMPVVLPRLPDGGCEFILNEREDVMGFLGEDEIFLRFARELG